MANDEALQQFVELTGAPADAAQFYLDSSNGDVETAISAYFESGGNAGAAAEQNATALPDDDPDFMVPEEDDEEELQPAAAPVAAAAAGASGSGRPKRSTRSQAQGGVRSLGDLAQDDDSDSDDGQEGNELFTGGAKSGQVVRAPKKDKGNDVTGLFDRARQAGAVDGTAADLQAPSAAGGGSSGGAFSGTARTLAGGDAPAQPAAPTAQDLPPQPIVHTITFYANGVFTVDDGEPRSMNDEANRPFMESISRGECPRELDPGPGGAPVNVNLVRNHNDYEPPAKPAYMAFSGAGRTLAGSGPTEPAAAAAPPPAAAAAAAGPSGGGDTAPSWPGPDESQPTTSIQLRLADGSRLVARFNLSQTVGDLRSFIAALRPDVKPGYRLAVPFPPAPLDDDSATIEGAGLQNAVVVQKP